MFLSNAVFMSKSDICYGAPLSYLKKCSGGTSHQDYSLLNIQDLNSKFLYASFNFKPLNDLLLNYMRDGLSSQTIKSQLRLPEALKRYSSLVIAQGILQAL